MKLFNPDNSAWRWCRRYLKWKFFLTVGLLVYVMFGTDNNLLETYSHDREIEALKQEIQSYNDTLAYYQELNAGLIHDPGTMERIVREQYHMQRDGEEVFIVTHTGSTK